MTTTMLRPAIGRDALEYRDALHPERSLVIHTYRPGAHAPDDPVVLVQHGIRRNGDEYRDFWIDAAEKHRLLVVATTFGNGAFPQPENYNNGMVVAPGGAIPPLDQPVMAYDAARSRAVLFGGADAFGMLSNQVWTYIHPGPNFFIHQYLLGSRVDHKKNISRIAIF
jgi:hypothetical protein